MYCGIFNANCEGERSGQNPKGEFLEVPLCLPVPEDVQKVIEDAKTAIRNGELTIGTAIGASADEIAEIKAWAGRSE